MQKFDHNVDDTAEVLQHGAKDNAQKNKKRLVYAVEFLFGLILGSLLSHFFF